MGPQAGMSIFIVLLVSLVIFALKKPRNPNTENEPKQIQNIAFVSMILCIMIAGLVALKSYGIVKSDDELLFSIFVLIYGILLDIVVPILYINNIPNMKEYVSECIQNGLNFIVSNCAFIFAKTINSFYDLVPLFQHPPRIYPTIE